MEHKKQKLLTTAINTALKGKGFERSNRTWRLECKETILVVNLQKSPWGNEFYINLGILIKSLSANAKPRINQCHIVERLDALTSPFYDSADDMPPKLEAVIAGLRRDPGASLDMATIGKKEMKWLRENRQPLEKALDLDVQMADDKRVSIVQLTLLDIGLEFLHSCSTVSKIRKCLRTNKLSGAAVWGVVFELCGVSIPQ